ncbi:hypothetical protein DIPPA_00270 [Diplonema papillatum]|nr:hypothetical protein DIPPA_00270 [Diplonema papillatum]
MKRAAVACTIRCAPWRATQERTNSSVVNTMVSKAQTLQKRATSELNEAMYQRYASEPVGLGRLDFKDFKYFVEETGVAEFTDDSLHQLFNNIDKDSNGTIDKAEFLSWWPQVSHKYLESTSPMAAYDILVAEKEVRPDPSQRRALKEFQRVHNQIVKHLERVAAAEEKQGFFSSLFAAAPVERSFSDIRGLYVCGGVGCGKSFLMDLFYDKISLKRKKRVHFNSFMLDMHLRMHNIKKKDPSIDVIKAAAREITKDVDLLCFDEFQITDIGDAMIVRRLFTALYDNGLVMVATSNRRPDDLYEGGLNRHIFLPFIKLLKKYNVTHEMASGTDYRTESVRLADTTYVTPLTAQSEKKIMDIVKKLVCGKPLEPSSVKVFGRDVPVRGAANGVAVFTFDDVCKMPMSTADYGAIAKNFHTIVVTGIPAMTLNDRTEARRFIYLVDELYENKCNFLCTAAVLPDALFSGKGIEGLASIDLESADAFGITNAADTALFTGSDEVFAFGRAVSRLNEMQSREYLLEPHRKHGLAPEVKSWVESLEA